MGFQNPALKGKLGKPGVEMIPPFFSFLKYRPTKMKKKKQNKKYIIFFRPRFDGLCFSFVLSGFCLSCFYGLWSETTTNKRDGP